MGIDAQNTPSQFIGVGLPHHGGAGTTRASTAQAVVSAAGWLAFQSDCPAGHMSLNVEDVLGGESQPGQRAPVLTLQIGPAVLAEGIESVVRRQRVIVHGSSPTPIQPTPPAGASGLIGLPTTRLSSCPISLTSTLTWSPAAGTAR